MLSRQRTNNGLAGVLLTVALLMGGPVYGEGEEWVYTFRPGDTLWELCTKYVSAKNCWGKVAQRNKIENPRQIPPGSKLYLPIAWLKVLPGQAKAVSVEGEPIVIREGKENSIIAKGDVFSMGDQLESRSGNFLLEFADGSQLLVKPGSELTFDTLTLYGESGMVDTRVRLNRGRVRAKVSPAKGSGSRYEISTPSAVAAVRGTEFRVVSVDGSDASMRAEVLEGNVQVGNDLGALQVAEGFAVKTQKGQSVEAPVKLLLPPELTVDVEEVVNTFPLELRWRELDAAAHYRIEVFSIEDESLRLLLDEETENSTFDIGLLEKGQYSVNIRGVDGNGFEGKDRVITFAVNDPKLVVQDNRWWSYALGSAFLLFLVF